MRQRGVALITAIVVVAIATILAVRIGTRAALDLRRTAGLVALDQGWHVALGAEAWAIEVLKEDYEDSPDSDHLAEGWAQPLPPLPVDGGEVRGAVEDMQGRFNVNNLVDANGAVDPDSVERFGQLLLLVGAQPRWASLMADWIDNDAISGIPEGAEDGTYLSQDPPYRASNRLVSTTTEMMALPGMTRDEFERIRPYVAALPRGTKINVCTAKAAVLAMLGEGMLDFSNEELLTANRRDGCFPTPDMFSHIPQQDRDRLLSTSTSWFRALTAVRIGTSEFTLYSLINRGGNASAIRTVLRSTGTE
jgi:general secretion pathway protein K